MSNKVILNIITLSLMEDGLLFETIESVVNFSRKNNNFTVKHIVVLPKGVDTIQKIQVRKNYSLILLNDDNQGIYPAFNLALKSCAKGYALFLSAGDTFVENIQIEEIYFKRNADLVCFGTRILGRNGFIDYVPNKKEYLRNSIPHASLFLNVDKLKHIGGFPEDLNSAADFYITAKICKNSKLILDNELIITNFNLGGVSSNFKSIIHYINSLQRLDVPFLKKCYLSIRKIASYFKYRYL